MTIFVPNDLPKQARRRARDAAPTYGWSRATNARLMRSAGFVDVEELDYTDAFLATLRGWQAGSFAREPELVALWGRQLFDDRAAERSAAIEAVESGWQRRVMISASRPARRAHVLSLS